MNMRFFLIILMALHLPAQAQDIDTLMSHDKLLPIRGLAIAAPTKMSLNRFVKFIHEELAPRKINTLVLRVDYNFEYKSHPELVNDNALSQKEVNKLVNACQQHDINLIPQINLLGHQSWHSKLEKLLTVYPEFDETPSIKLPEKYVWPNEDGLYCKSYCPLHPDVHEVVFALVDEITAAFQADAFHAGMDEVFYIGEEECPRCRGKNKAELFANELTKIRNHLAASGKKLWIWGDRLLDGNTTGLGMWEASTNHTHRAIDMIPKDIMICDWHYEKVEPTAAYFALKGFDVVTCSWRQGETARKQLALMKDLRYNSSDETGKRVKGMVHTCWRSVSSFLDRFYSPLDTEILDDAMCFRMLFE